MSDNSAILNGLFVDAVSTSDGLEKLAEVGGAYIQKILRETSFARQILPPVNVTRTDVTRSVDHDGFVKIIDIEPDSKAMAMNFLGEPDGRYITGKRYAVPFFRVASEDFSKDETELMAYDYPITRVIEENSVKDIQEIEDKVFMKYVDAGIRSNAMFVNYVGTTKNLSKAAVKTLINLIEAKRLKAEVLLMASTTWNDVLEFDYSVLGSDLISKVTVEGYTYNTFLGRKVITSIKESMFFKNSKFQNAGTVTVVASTSAVAATKTFNGTFDIAMIGVGDAVVVSGAGANTGLTTTVTSVTATTLVVAGTVVNEAGAETLTITAKSLKTIYAFTAPRFLGHFFILNQTKFVIKKDMNIITFRAWEDVAIGIGNLNAAAGVTLDS
jgi:hypothetical protein